MSHKDYFGKPIEVGDVLLGAKAGGKYFDTVYSFVVVVSKTPKLIKVHQLNVGLREVTKENVQESLAKRYGRRAGKAHPHCFISTNVNVGLTQAEMEKAIQRAPAQVVDMSSPWVDSIFP